MTRSILIDLLDLVDIPNTDKQTITSALESGFKDFEDAAQMFCAKNGNADIIVTRDIDDFRNSEIPVVTPTAFLLQHSELL